MPAAYPHNLDVNAALESVGSQPTGLASEEAAQRLQEHGLNRLPQASGPSPWMRFLSQFHNVLIYVLIVSAGITAALGHYVDTAVILAVVIGNAVIGYLQEGKAEQAMEAIREMLAPKTSVLRSGQRQTIDSSEVVPGDIVLLDPGERVPADMRMVGVAGLRIDEAILTGESLPVDKGIESVDPDAPIGDRSCMAFSGTLVTAGTGRGVVVATGTKTEIGRISGLLSEVRTLTTPLVRQMDVFARWLTIVILGIAALMLAYGAMIGQMAFAELFMNVVGLAVAAIPEGLPAVVTITLAVGVQAMARRNAIIRRLPAIETLGSVSVICSDKTGTLTRNEMMVASMATSDQGFTVTGSGYAPDGQFIDEEGAEVVPLPESVDLFSRVASRCNDAVLANRDGAWVVEGDPMEGALQTFAAKLWSERPGTDRSWKRTDAIPFDASHQYMAVLDHDHQGNAAIHIKGAPEKVLDLCGSQNSPKGTKEPLDREYWRRRVEAIAQRGQRVLAFAIREVPQDQVVLNVDDTRGDCVFVGLVGLIDPPRPEAIEAVRECHQAGIQVKMITGDHATTAAAIAKQIGLSNPDSPLTGTEIDRLDDEALAAAVRETDVFARTSPEHKLRLVSALQALGLSVAMTGDGVNDAPALKRADAGIAMGAKGSAAAKEASDLVLADDNFATIAAAVREGRTVYDNIKKTISWVLPTNAGEAMTIIIALFAGMALPITAVQILWVNLVTAITLGLALAFEPTEAGTMRRPPRKQDDPLLSPSVTWHIVLVSSLFIVAVFGVFSYAIDRGSSVELARTLALNTLVALEVFHLFFIRNHNSAKLTWKALRGTRVVWICVGAVVLAQVALTYLSPLQALFETRPLPPLDLLLILVIGAIFFFLVELEKLLRIRRRPA